MKGQKNEILTRKESRLAYRTGRHSSRPDVFYFFATAHFLKQLPTHIAHTCLSGRRVAKAPRVHDSTKALAKNAIFVIS